MNPGKPIFYNGILSRGSQAKPVLQRAGRQRTSEFGFRLTRLLTISVTCFLASSCSHNQAPRGDNELIVAATLKLLAQNSVGVCVDNSTAGKPLAVFRTMTLNRPAGMPPLAWYVPTALRPVATLSSLDIVKGTQSDAVVHIDQPANTTPALAPQVQDSLNRKALKLSSTDAGIRVSGIGNWQIPGVVARNWLRNKLSKHCTPYFRITNPISDSETGFVSVLSSHWATTYQFVKQGGNWVPSAQWSNWRY